MLICIHYYSQIFIMWLDFVTYLHHHGHEEKLPWYRGKVLIDDSDSITHLKTGLITYLQRES